MGRQVSRQFNRQPARQLGRPRSLGWIDAPSWLLMVTLVAVVLGLGVV